MLLGSVPMALAADMPTGGKDHTGHVSFDTQRLVNGGAGLDPRQVSTDWVQAKMLERCTSIEYSPAQSS